MPEISALYVYPIKSCAGISLSSSVFDGAGLLWDRTFALADEDGYFYSQRECARMAQIQVRFAMGQLAVTAPGMLRLDIPLDSAGEPHNINVWGDTVVGLDMGDLCATWFSTFCGTPLRLIRINPDAMRQVNPEFTDGKAIYHQFGDGFPMLVTSTGSLDDLNQRLVARGESPVPMERFRPNIVINGLSAWDEDHIDALTVERDGVTVGTLKLVKPCPRCEVPGINPADASMHHEPMRTLGEFRSLPRMGGSICFGENAVYFGPSDDSPADGQTADDELQLRVGDQVEVSYRF